MEVKTKQILIAIFLVTLIIRLILAFTIPNFTYESYFHLRQVEEIIETGSPLYNDPLSYGGREHIFLPLFHYLMAFFSLFIPLTIVAKVLPNLFLATLTILVYLIAYKVTHNKTASLLSAFIAGFLPVLYSTNSFTVSSLFLPLVFLAIYSFMNLPRRKFVYLYLLTFLFLSFLSSSTFLIIIGFGIYLLLSLIEGKKIAKAEIEIVVFSIFFFIWSQFLFFKNTLTNEGISFIWQNIPPQIISQYFPEVSILNAIVLVSIIPFLAGIYIVYRSLFHLRNPREFLLISLVISTTIMAWMRLIQFRMSLVFFGIILAILFSSFYLELVNFSKKTKGYHLKRFFPLALIILLVLTMIPPAISTVQNQPIPSDEEISAFIWIRDNLPPDETILASLEEGYLLTYYAQRKNFMDEQFELVGEVEKRFQDLDSFYTTKFQTLALDLFNEHNISYIMLTPHAKERFDVPRLRYHSPQCFQRLYTNETKIYKVVCTLERIEAVENEED